MKTNAIVLLLMMATVSLSTGCQTTNPTTFGAFKPSDGIINSPTIQNSAPSLVTLSSTDQLDSILQQAPGVVLIDFYADWCKPCQRQGEILKKLESTASANQAQIVKVNVDEHPALAQKFKANALPTILVFKQGHVVDRQRGLSSAAKVTSLLKL